MGHRKAKTARDKSPTCRATTKLGKPCTSPGKYGGYCGLRSHLAQGGLQPEPDKDGSLCGAYIKLRGKTCDQPAGMGTSHKGFGVCRFHGGLTKTHIKKAQKQMAAEAVVTLGLPIKVSPEAALLQRVCASAGNVAYCEKVIRAMDPKDVVWSVTEKTFGGAASMPHGKFTVYSAAPNIWIDMYNTFTAQLVNVCKVAIQCGLQKRQVELAEQHGRLLLVVLEGVLREMGIKTDSPKVQAILGEQLRLVSGAAEEVKL